MIGYAPGWQVRCPKCGLTFDAAELGLIRISISAVGHQHLLRWCQQCRRPRWLSVEHRPRDLPEPAGARCDVATHVAHVVHA